MRRLGYLLLLTLVACGKAQLTPAEAMLKGVDYLAARQNPGAGGWQSEVYGLLRPGHSLTALALVALAEQPIRVPRALLLGGVEFLRRQCSRDGGLGRTEFGLDYPNYATGLTLRALGRLQPEHEMVAAMRRYLVEQQFGEARGWTDQHPAHGGWGMGGELRHAPDTPGHLDLSMTRVVLQGLAATGGIDPATKARALRFLARCQNPDGGFYFSPVVLGANKGLRQGKQFGSYGSTTADGVLSLLALGVPPGDERVRRAQRWLVQHHRVDRVPGVATGVPVQWGQGIRFYYLWVSAEAFSALQVQQAPAGQDWRVALRSALLPAQRSDGSWANPQGVVKEDDPIIATCLALLALNT